MADDVTTLIDIANFVNRDNIGMVDSTSSIFHRSALSAIRKWKYNPKVVDGKAVEQPGERVTLDFVLEDG